MKLRERDKLYCGVSEPRIINAEPILNWNSVHYFKEFVIDRYRIHKRKDVQEKPAPWTKNVVLQEFKFTNVRREHDRQSRYLIENISLNPSLTLEDKIVNTFLFRAWNNWATLRDFQFPHPAEILYTPTLKEHIRPAYEALQRVQPDRLWYSNAYNQGGTKCAWKFADADIREVPYKFGNEHEMGDDQFDDYEPEIPLRPFHIGVWLGRGHIVSKILKCKNQQQVFETIKSVRGFADFLAYQVFVDLTYIPEFPFSENEFVVAGPGCKKGLDYIFLDRGGMNYEECIFWLRNSINRKDDSLFCRDELFDYEEEQGLKHKNYEPVRLFNDLPEYDRCMNVMSLENCMCELSKYMRAVTGTGRPKNKYKPFVEK